MSSLKTAFANAVMSRNGAAIAQTLSITQPKLVEFAYSTNEASVNKDLDLKGLIKKIPAAEVDKWTQIYILCWHVADNAVIKSNVYAVYDHMNALLVCLNQLAVTADRWILKALMVVAKQLRELSILCDKTASVNDIKKRNSDDRPYLENATRTINRTFQLCLNDRHTDDMEKSKKLGIYFFINELLRIYFILDKQQSLGKNLLKALNSVDHPPFETYPKPQQVTTAYYTGVCYFADENYGKAYESLSLALGLCLKSSEVNIEKILLYLIPTKIIMSLLNAPNAPNAPEKGLDDKRSDYLKDSRPTEYLISRGLLSRYSRLHTLYSPLLRAIDKGDLQAYDLALQKRKHLFIRKYLYIVFERIRLIVAKNLLKHVYGLLGGPTRVEVKVFKHILEWQGYFPYTLEAEEVKREEDMLDQTEGLVSQLIFHGRIKGYISHERRTIVLRAGNAFV